MFFLSFDYGMKSIGIAVGQNITKSAKILTTLKIKNGNPDWKMIKNFIQDWKPSFLIVGLPLNMDGTEQIFTIKTKKFAKDLYKKFNIQVKMHDERLSTIEARATLFNKGGIRFLTKKNINGLSAVYILESWLRNKKF